MRYCYLDSAIGPLLLAGEGDTLHRIWFPDGKGRAAAGDDWRQDKSAFPDARRQLTEYFAGERKSFDMAFQPSGTQFQLSVLAALQEIPYGQTASYGEIAERIGRPKAVRAVGAANGRNPLPIVIPCHRVIGASGALTGFGGGLPAKKFLLELESKAFQLS